MDIFIGRTLGSENSEYQYWMDLELDANDYIYLAANMNEEISHQGGTNTSYGITDFLLPVIIVRVDLIGLFTAVEKLMI